MSKCCDCVALRKSTQRCAQNFKATLRLGIARNTILQFLPIEFLNSSQIRNQSRSRILLSQIYDPDDQRGFVLVFRQCLESSSVRYSIQRF